MLISQPSLSVVLQTSKPAVQLLIVQTPLLHSLWALARSQSLSTQHSALQISLPGLAPGQIVPFDGQTQRFVARLQVPALQSESALQQPESVASAVYVHEKSVQARVS